VQTGRDGVSVKQLMHREREGEREGGGRGGGGGGRAEKERERHTEREREIERGERESERERERERERRATERRRREREREYRSVLEAQVCPGGVHHGSLDRIHGYIRLGKAVDGIVRSDYADWSLVGGR